jgi:uncharacterized membrane protein
MRAQSRNLLAALFLLATVTGTASAEVTLEYLGTGLATDVSEDGTVVTGLAGLSYEVFRWTEATGIVPLGRIAPAQAGTPDISEDGTRISGTIASTDSLFATPGLWTEFPGWESDPAAGWQELIPPMLPDGGEMDRGIGSAWGMSGDGNTVVGLYWRAGQPGGSANAFAWHPFTGAVSLGPGPDGRQSRASDVNYDGSVVVGFDENPVFGNRWPAVWVDGVKTILGTGENATEATAVNNDGTIIGGTYWTSETSELREAVLWHWNGVSWDLQVLGSFFGTHPVFGGAQVNDMTPGAEIVVGINSFGGGSADGFIWTQENGMQEIGEFLLENGISIDPNLDLLSVTAITNDGSVIVGTARETVAPWDYKSWLVRMPRITDAPAPMPVVAHRLGMNVPNPFNPQTTIPVTLDRDASLTLEVIDVAGRRVKTLHQGPLGAGRHEFVWSGKDAYGRQVSSGVYYSRLVGQDGRAESKPMALVK